jgi:RHS repeat-associated protein
MRKTIALGLLVSGLSLCSATAFGAVGRTKGQFQVSSTGTAQYSIPIWAPPGPRGIQPNVSLVYDSRSGIGPLGVGWSLGGLGGITRCNKTYAQDTTPAAVALATSDGYCINGKRLRLTSGTYGNAGSVYQTEIADFSQITAVGTTGNGPDYFTVQGRNGLTYYYGYTDSNGNGANSQVLATGTSTADYWLLSKVIDRAGNNYVINYTLQTGTAVPNYILWTPTSAGGSSYTYKMLFNYTSNVPQSSIIAYIGGTQVQNTELLSSIEIFVSGTVVKDYFLGYQASPTTGREELISVTECPTTTESGSNCLAPTNVTYQNGGLGVSTTSTSALSSSGTGLTARYDLNGDGYPDLVYNNGTSWYVSFGSASGYGTPVNTGIASSRFSLLIGNLNGGTEDGILAPNGSTWWYYTWNGSSFTGTSTGRAYDSTPWQYQLADVNGDGLPDLVALYQTLSGKLYINTVDVWLNTGAGGAVSFGSPSTWYTADALSGELQTPDMQFGTLRRYDFNGDGRDDLVLVMITGTPPNYNETTYELISTGTSFSATSISTVSTDSYVPVFFTNWNDDACTDFVTEGSLYISGCNGTVPATYVLNASVVGAMDWNGDGRTDLVAANGTTLEVYLSTGGAPGAPLSTSIPYSSTCQYVTMDANADGLDDLGCWSTSGSSPLTYYLHNGAGKPPDLLASITDGYGNSASPTYVSLAISNYTEHSGGDATYPYADVIAPFYAVSEVVFSDPSAQSGTYNQTFWYYGAWSNLQGRGFQSFHAKRMIDSRNGLYYFQYYEREFPESGMDYEDDVANNSGGQIGYVLRTPAVTTLSSATNEERYFPYFSNVSGDQYEVGGAENGDLITTTSTNYTYDNYGNATTIATTVTDNDPNSPYTGDTWTTTTTNTPEVDTTHWCLGLLTETQTAYSASVGGAVTRTKTFTPDTTNCRYTQMVTEPTANSGLYKVTEALTFDSFGNVATDTVTGANMPSSPASREMQLNWGTTGQFQNTSTDPSGAVTTWTYTSNQALTFGVPDSMKDANTLTTSWVYDAFGRKTGETRSDGTSTGWAWSLCTSHCSWSNSVYQVAQTAYQTNGTTVIRTDTSSYDPIDRVTQTVGPTVTGTAATVQKLYNSLGLLTQQSMPFLSGATAYQQTFAYDALNRPTSVTRPISSTNSNPQSTTYGYAGRTATVSDPYGNVKTNISDVNGWLRQAKDALGYAVTRAYDSAGSLTGITDGVGNTLLNNVTVVYGINPFITAATDADRGAWTYTIDSLGEKTSWTDAKGQPFSMSYDALSRPLSRTDPDLFTNWNYGSAAPNWGRLTSECTQSASTANLCTTSGSSWLYNQFYTYDGLSRLSARTIVQSGNTGGNDGGGAFVYTRAYSATTGLLNTLTYPKSTSGFALTLQYGYGYGLLQSITDTSDTTATCGTTCVLWTANAQNAFGEVTQETLGNGVVTNRSFDAVTSWLSAATAGVGGGSAILNQSYLEDENGNIIQRQDNNLGLTESFSYDKDYRLTCAALSSTCSTPTFVYDAGSAGPGNITTQTGVGTYTYPAAGQPRPHAVTSITGTFNGITNPTFSYDANGNMTDRASSSANIAWFSSNYPASISASDASGSEEVEFQYGPDRERWQQIYNGPTGTKTSYYVGKALEVVFIAGETYYRHYIYAGSKPVAVYIRNSDAGITMSYLSMDHEGSISAITINTGAVGADESFAAFGARRDPSSWSGPPSASNLSAIENYTRQGYTFQTWLGESMGLNHMNGRVEDAVLGRMLSPDPHIPHPTNAQSYNRYSYVNNNPLTMVDPSGFGDTPPALPYNGPAPNYNFSGSIITEFSAGSSIAIIPGASFSGGTGGSGSSGGGGGGSSNPIAGFEQWATGWIDPSLDQSQPDFSGDDALDTSNVVGQGQYQSGSLVTGSEGTNTFSDGSTLSSSSLEVTAGKGSATAETVSTVTGYTGVGAAIAEPALGERSLGSNLRFYRVPRGNQYFYTLFKLGTAARVTGIGAVVVGTFADYYNANATGNYFQANLNLGLGSASVAYLPLAVPTSMYFIASQNTPGGPAAYNAAFSGAINAAEGDDGP